MCLDRKLITMCSGNEMRNNIFLSECLKRDLYENAQTICTLVLVICNEYDQLFGYIHEHLQFIFILFLYPWINLIHICDCCCERMFIF